HEKYKTYRNHGEWFCLPEEEVAGIIEYEKTL
ncbi:unnamed protein product, partial [marine sediment metagenome]